MDNYYLCYRHKYNLSFKCKLFNSIESADNYYYDINKSKIVKNSNILIINKYIPVSLHKYIIEYKLFNLFIKNRIFIFK